jgi:protein AroM
MAAEEGRRRVGLITIGQAPRVDMVPEMETWLGPVRTIERGALDEMTPDGIATLRPTPDDYALITRLSDGSSATIAERHILPRIQSAIADLEAAGAEAVVLLCTGEFPPFDHERPLLTAQRLIVDGVRAIAGGSRVGVVCPLPEQERLTRDKWSDLSDELYVASGSPYDEDTDDLRRAARHLGEIGVDYVVLDCMGYTQKMKDLVRKEAGAPVLLARSVVARLAAEVIW